MFIIHWHDERAKVVSRFDTIGIFVMLLYVAFSVSRTWLFGHWIHGSVLTAFTYSILAGVMIGRIIGMRLKIKIYCLSGLYSYFFMPYVITAKI